MKKKIKNKIECHSDDRYAIVLTIPYQLPTSMALGINLIKLVLEYCLAYPFQSSNIWVGQFDHLLAHCLKDQLPMSIYRFGIASNVTPNPNEILAIVPCKHCRPSLISPAYCFFILSYVHLSYRFCAQNPFVLSHFCLGERRGLPSLI